MIFREGMFKIFKERNIMFLDRQEKEKKKFLILKRTKTTDVGNRKNKKIGERNMNFFLVRESEWETEKKLRRQLKFFVERNKSYFEIEKLIFFRQTFFQKGKYNFFFETETNMLEREIGKGDGWVETPEKSNVTK